MTDGYGVILSNTKDRPLGDLVTELLTSESGPVTVVSPFITLRAFERIHKLVDPSTPLTVFTRWQLSEIAAGVSDPDIFPLISNGFADRNLFLVPSLHAKVYLRGKTALIGSANLTFPGMGWGNKWNAETLVALPLINSGVEDFLSHLKKHAVIADRKMYEHAAGYRGHEEFAATLAMDFRTMHLGICNVQSDDLSGRDHWIPQTVQPNNLYKFYAGETSSLLETTIECARADLSYVNVPIGLEQKMFEQFVRDRIEHEPIIEFFDQSIMKADPVKYFADELQISIDQASGIFEVTERWVHKFFPDQYSFRVLQDSTARTVKKRQLGG